MNINRDVDAKFLEAFSDSNINLWDQNIVNGQYIIAYELNPGLDRLIQTMLPKVSFISELQFLNRNIIYKPVIGYSIDTIPY